MTAKPLLVDTTSSEELARLARLKYVLDDEAGFMRHMNGAGFQYMNGHGRRLRDTRHINRIELLAIPPAWTDVWISARADASSGAVTTSSNSSPENFVSSQPRSDQDE